MKLTAEQVRMLIATGSVLFDGGLATVAQVQAVIKLLRPDVPEDQLNGILAAVRDDAKRRQELARQDQAQAARDAAARDAPKA